MKKNILTLAVSLLLISAVSLYAATPETTGNENKITKEVIDNLLVGLHSDNLGLRLSCAYYLGEYNAGEAVIPLMRLLHNDKTDEGRIVAALSLMKISSDKAHFAVKQAGRMDDSERVRKLCSRFYEALYNEDYNAAL